ncbi:ABC transporter substrate-binding protein [Rhizobium mayense]|uniref:ABC transporter substrate-binding protein n=1 Tax=Rhizobium mayense TaxID=1312184 RepID=A0ABT7K1X1_9HYPH|nr:ABC transporter substrate-binding protein [Rhizobium mayense]MDL2402005.1 ABC transporter substrate-binding protein [Rhizobium mayense]
MTRRTKAARPPEAGAKGGITRRTLLASVGIAAAMAHMPRAFAAGDPKRISIRLGSRDIGSVDPAMTKTGDDETVALQIFNSLVSPPRGTLDVDLDKLQPVLAKSWDISPDRKTWTFHLRPGVKWHKGYGEVSAEDVKFSFERQMDPKLGGVHGASFKSIDSIDIVDPLTVRFNLKATDPFFHVEALIPGFGRFIVPKKAVEELGEKFGFQPVGSGAFEFSEYRPQEAIILKAFDGYFGGRAPLDELELRYIPDNNAATIAFIGGELDVTGGDRDPKWVKNMQAQNPDAVINTLLPGSLQFISFNMTVKPLDNLKVRQALAYAIDRSQWAKAFGVVHGDLPAIVPEEFFGALKASDIPAELRYDYSPEKAKALLAEAGYPNGFSLDAIISERDDYKTNMLMVQDMLRKIGVNLNLQVQDHASYQANIRQDRGTVVELSTAMEPTAPQVLNEFLSKQAAVGKPSSLRNFSHYGEVGGNIDDLVAKAVAEADAAKQLEYLKQAQLQVLKDVPLITLQTAPIITAFQGKIDLGYKPVSGYGQFEYSTAKLTDS